MPFGFSIFTLEGVRFFSLIRFFSFNPPSNSDEGVNVSFF